jgi:hypothetical protein
MLHCGAPHPTSSTHWACVWQINVVRLSKMYHGFINYLNSIHISNIHNEQDSRKNNKENKMPGKTARGSHSVSRIFFYHDDDADNSKKACHHSFYLSFGGYISIEYTIGHTTIAKQILRVPHSYRQGMMIDDGGSNDEENNADSEHDIDSDGAIQANDQIPASASASVLLPNRNTWAFWRGDHQNRQQQIALMNQHQNN